MTKRYFQIGFAALIFAFCAQFPVGTLVAQVMPNRSLPAMPNNHGKSLTTPTAWGASNNVLFVAAGGTTHLPYSSPSAGDGVALVGCGLGNPRETLGVQVALACIDLNQWDKLSSSFQLSRDFGNAGAAAFGVENIMLTTGGDGDKSFYIVYSQGAQKKNFINKQSNTARLHCSIGVGNGRFANKSLMDITHGKRSKGTSVFGNVSCEIAESFNLITDWNGTNLNAGISTSLTIGAIPFSITVGLADLTGNSGDGARLVFAGGYGFLL